MTFTLDRPEPARLRQITGKSQTALGELVGTSLRTWQSWEAAGPSARAIPAAAWELALLKTGQHPTMGLSKKPQKRG